LPIESLHKHFQPRCGGAVRKHVEFASEGRFWNACRGPLCPRRTWAPPHSAPSGWSVRRETEPSPALRQTSAQWLKRGQSEPNGALRAAQPASLDYDAGGAEAAESTPRFGRDRMAMNGQGTPVGPETLSHAPKPPQARCAQRKVMHAFSVRTKPVHTFSRPGFRRCAADGTVGPRLTALRSLFLTQQAHHSGVGFSFTSLNPRGVAWSCRRDSSRGLAWAAI
jgi:hypothetical protein